MADPRAVIPSTSIQVGKDANGKAVIQFIPIPLKSYGGLVAQAQKTHFNNQTTYTMTANTYVMHMQGSPGNETVEVVGHWEWGYTLSFSKDDTGQIQTNVEAATRKWIPGK